MKSPSCNHWWKPNTEQPCIENTKKLLLAFKYSKKNFRDTRHSPCANSSLSTAWKVSAFGDFLLLIFSHSDWIQRDTEYLSVFSPNAENTRIDYCNNLFIDIFIRNKYEEWQSCRNPATALENVNFVLLKMLYHLSGYYFLDESISWFWKWHLKDCWMKECHQTSKST